MRKYFTKFAASALALCMLVPTALSAQAASTYPGDDEVYAKRAGFTDLRGYSTYVKCVRDKDYQIWLADKSKNIRVVADAAYTAPNGNLSTERFTFPSDFDPLKKDQSTWNTKAQLLYNTEKVYDFYKNTLGHSDFDFGGRGDQSIYVFEFNNPGDARSHIKIDHYGHGPDEYRNMLYFGAEGDKTYSMGVDVGAVGHELTHLVVNKKLGWWPHGLRTETEALMEAYCDIMGELCEDEPDWMVAADVFKDNTSYNKRYSLRDMKSPQSTVNKLYENVYFGFYDNYFDYKNNAQWLAENYQYGSLMAPAYLATTIIDHAAYLMYQGGIPQNDLAHIWYNSMAYYTGDTTQATFLDCRNAVINAAVDYYRCGTGKVDIIKKAFDDVNVKVHHSELSQAAAAITTRMHDFGITEGYKLPEGSYWNTGDPDSSSRTAINNDQSTYLPMGPTAFKYFVNSYWQIEEPYYQCAGFAKKLQMDYFGTNSYVRVTDASYVPEIGDHLRVDRYYKGNLLMDNPTHSVFIRSLGANNTMTFADCNSDGNNIIRWNNNVNYYYDSSDGKLCYRLGDITYKFVWAERPLKLGDTNADGVLSYDDLTAMDNIISGNISYRMYDGLLRQYTADINGDYVVDSADRDILYQLIYDYNNARGRYGFVVY